MPSGATLAGSSSTCSQVYSQALHSSNSSTFAVLGFILVGLLFRNTFNKDENLIPR